MPQTPVKMIGGLADLAGSYDALICDIWGVLHNGTTLYPGVENALRRFLALPDRHVLLLSNAPRPGSTVQARLHEIGLPDDCYSGILTSGDAARALVAERNQAGRKGYHVGPAKDADLVAGFEEALTDFASADYILLSGLYDDMTETPDDYKDMIQAWRARALDVICANPDRLVPFGDRYIYCAGAIAEAYEKEGGTVTWLGKPHAHVYSVARERLSTMGAGSRILAIGDGPKTDILGANRAGIDVAFIAGGLGQAQDRFDLSSAEGVTDFLATENAKAQAAMKHLVW